MAKTMRDSMLDCCDWIDAVEERLCASVPETERLRQGTHDGWAPKDILSHITAWRQRMLQTITSGRPAAEEGGQEETDPTNAQLFEAYRGFAWPEILELTRQARREIRSLIAGSAEADLTDPSRFPWLGEQPLWRRIIGNLVLHPLTHHGQLLAELGRGEEGLALQLEAAERLLSLDKDPIWQGVTVYNRACAYALAGRKEPAFADLRVSLRLNPNLVEWSKQDTDLESLRGDPALAAVYAAVAGG